MSRGKLGILVGGGPAPGINSVISAATIKAIDSGLEVFGIYDGLKWFCQGDAGHVRQLSLEEASRIQYDGGSFLRTARDNPSRKPELMANTVKALQQLGLDYLVTIGGDDTASSAHAIDVAMGGALRVAHVPKTIDNDLPLPGGMPTFGFQTAREIGARLVQNLVEDARTTGRWYIVVAMGRKAGHLALGMGKTAGATLTIIAEEFRQKTLSLAQVCHVLEGAILKRRVMGRRDGVAVVAEGVAERIAPNDLANRPGVVVSHDAHGHLELREIPLARILKAELEERFAARGDKATVVAVDLGYELRCAAPIPYDAEYTRDLGWGAVNYLLSDAYHGGALVCLVEGRIQLLPFDQLIDPATQHARVRMVDTESDAYRSARDYMVRLEPADLADEQTVGRLAAAAKVTPEEFRRRFAGLV